MKNLILLFTLSTALFIAPAPAAPSSFLPEPGTFRIMPTSASEPVMFYCLPDMMFGTMSEWKGSTLYVESWPVEYELSRVSLAQPYTFSEEAFHQQIHFLDIRPSTDIKLPPPQPAGGKYDFNIGYQF